ncbi:MAG: DUF4339 domain-containing protein, partial [Akkermansiaceae bacterium]|nr:DUF4339 domain-containing protein [Akkermansiaceae bacterium]
PVSEQELRRLLKEGVIRPSTNVLRKGENQWRRLSDFLPPQAEPAAPSGAGRTGSPEQLYYYASPEGRAAGPVSEQELRRLLKEGVIRPTTSVLRKGENQWLPLGYMLNDPEPPAGGEDSFRPPLPPEQQKGAHASIAGAVLSMEALEEKLNILNSFIDKRLYSLFGFRKLVPYFEKWVHFSMHLTSLMTILSTMLLAFAIASVLSAPPPKVLLYANPYAPLLYPGAMETAQKAAEAEGGMSGEYFLKALAGGLLLGILLQYISALFSKANINYFFGRKPVLPSMLLPRLNIILLCIALLGTIYWILSLNGVYIFLAVLGLAALLYMIWLNLNCDRLFMEVAPEEASGSSDLIGYMMYQLRFFLIAVQTLIPLWLLGLCVFYCVTIFSADKEGRWILMLIEEVKEDVSVFSIISCLFLLAAPVALHLIYIVAALVPELLLSILKGWKKPASIDPSSQTINSIENNQ